MEEEPSAKPQSRPRSGRSQTRRDQKKLTDWRPAIEAGQISAFFLDECHLLWGDACGYIWGPTDQRVEVPIENSRRRQTYYGAVNIFTGQFYLRPYERANGHYTVTFVRYLLRHYPEQQLVIFWDGATYHRYGEMIEFLQKVNQGLTQDQWRVTCVLLTPHAPQENPVEDVWLKAKTFVRRHFYLATSFDKVKQLFMHAIKSESYFDFPKLDQYMPTYA